MRYLLLAGALACSASVRGEVTSVSDAGFVIDHTAVAAADPAAVWAVLVAPNRWWSPDHTYSGDSGNLYLDAQATGCFCEKLPRPANAPESQRMGSVEHMHVVFADPQRRVLRMTGGLGPLQGEAVHGVLTVTLKGEGGGTKIAWHYAVGGYWQAKPTELAPLVDKVIGEQVARLAALPGSAETAPDRPER